jgi:hypothetical protein
MPTRNQIFISYAHADAAWRDEFTDMLQPAIARGSISMWSDQNIAVGDSWSKDITDALSSAAARLLLVTPAFLKSVKSATSSSNGCSSSRRRPDRDLLGADLADPLHGDAAARRSGGVESGACARSIEPSDRHAAIQQICLQIVEEFGFLPKVTGSRRQRLPEDVRRASATSSRSARRSCPVSFRSSTRRNRRIRRGRSG